MSDFYAQNDTEQVRRLESVARSALPQWNWQDATLRLIKYRENAVFEANCGDERGALRVHRHGYHSDASLKSEASWMRALAEDGIAVPQCKSTATGDIFVTQSGDGLPGAMQIDLFDWIDGEQMGSLEDGLASTAAVTRTFADIGALMARVHNQSSAWTLPKGFERHAWDEHGLAGDAPLWGRFWELAAASPEQSQVLEDARRVVFDDLAGLEKSRDNYSLIHADFVQENVLIHNGELRLIDFDDAGFGWHMFEIATCLYFIQQEPWFDTAREALIAGYRQHRQLSESVIATLPLFMLARGLTYVGWVHTRPGTPTALEMTPMLLEMACALANEYLTGAH